MRKALTPCVGVLYSLCGHGGRRVPVPVKKQTSTYEEQGGCSRNMNRAISCVPAGSLLWALLLLSMFNGSPLMAGDDGQAGGESPKTKTGKQSGKVVAIDTNSASITIRPRVIPMTSGPLDESTIPT